MTLLKNRIKKLEAIKPAKKRSLVHLTSEALDEQYYLACKAVHDKGGKLDTRSALMSVRCREFFNDEPWLKMTNHRISVFQEFLSIAYKQNLPEKIKAVFGLGWRNVPIPEKDIELTVKTLHDADLGEETPWLKEYLKNSGVVNEYHQYQYQSIDNI